MTAIPNTTAAPSSATTSTAAATASAAAAAKWTIEVAEATAALTKMQAQQALDTASSGSSLNPIVLAEYEAAIASLTARLLLATTTQAAFAAAATAFTDLAGHTHAFMDEIGSQ